MRIRESPRLHFRICPWDWPFFFLEHTRLAEERPKVQRKRKGRALLLLVLHSHFCQQSLEIQVDHSLADRVRARIVTGLPSNKRSFHPTIGKYFSSSRAIFKRRPANPSRVKKMSVNVSISQWWSTKIKELHHGRIRGAASAAIVWRRHQNVTSLSQRDPSISFLDLSQYQNSTWELVEHDFAGGGGGATKISPPQKWRRRRITLHAAVAGSNALVLS
jgi:hypothetical protein